MSVSAQLTFVTPSATNWSWMCCHAEMNSAGVPAETSPLPLFGSWWNAKKIGAPNALISAACASIVAS